MLKQVLTSASVLGLMLVCHLPAQAQNKAPAANPQEQAAPKPQGQQAPETQISQQELQKFASAIKQLLAIEQEANKQMIQAIQQAGLTPDRFEEINRVQQNSQEKPAKPVSQEEKQKFAQARDKVSAIGNQVQPKMTKAIQDQGLDVPRFEQIMAAVQQNPALQKQVQQLIKGKEG